MARKPDLFQKIVDKLVSGSFPSDELLITKSEVVQLLRRYHARVRKMVKTLESSKKVPLPWDDYHKGYYSGVHDAYCMLLILLDRLKKGTP